MSNQQIGPVGGSGTKWDNLPTVSGWGCLSGLAIRHGDIIDNIQPLYGCHAAPSQGGPSGSLTRIDLQGDPLVAMTGYTGMYFGAMQVVQISFRTLGGKVFGPFGTMQYAENRKSFELVAPGGCYINSFFGATVVHTDGTTYIAALGGNTEALEKLVTKAGPVGGPTTSEFNDWPAAQYLGSIVKLSVWHGDVIDALQAQYNGQTLPKHGGPGGQRSDIAFTPTDPLVGISGSFGPYVGATQILQLTLKSRSGRIYGPFGTAPGGKQFEFAAGPEQIGALFGGEFRHTDGSDFLSSLGVVMVRM